MGKYIEYLRKSQMDRDFEDLSVEETLKRHRKELAEFTRKNKINVVLILEEVVSAESLSARPQMLKLLELVNTGEYDGIVCKDIDRISRGSSFDSGYIMQILQVNNCKIVTPDKTYDLRNEQDEQFADMKFMFSRYELKTITKRLVNGRNASASEGKFMGSIAPLGYDIVKIKGDKGNTLEINPEEAEIVKMIYNMYTIDRMGYNAIAYKLNQMHLKTKTGRKWGQTSVVNALSNVVYTGKIRWKCMPQEKIIVDGVLKKKRVKSKSYEIHDGLHPAIISEEQFDLAQEMKSQRYIPSVKIDKEVMNPFAEIMFCEKCSTVIARKTYNHRTNTRPRFQCKQQGKVCDCKGTSVEDVENAVVTEMREWLKEYMISLENTDITADDSLEVALDLLEKQLTDLQKQQENICELLEKRVYTVDLFTKRNAALQEEIDQTMTAIFDLKEQMIEQEEAQETVFSIVPTSQYLLDNYETLTPREKNDLWKQVLEKITYYKGETKGVFHVTIFPKLPCRPVKMQ